MGVISELALDEQNKIITLAEAFRYLKRLDNEASDLDILKTIRKIQDRAPVFVYSPATGKLRQHDGMLPPRLSDNFTPDITRKISLSAEIVFCIKHLLNKHNTKITNQIKVWEEKYSDIGFDRLSFISVLEELGIDTSKTPFEEHTSQSESSTIFSGCDFANLGDVVDDILRLNPTYPHSKDILAKVLAEGTNFSWSHDITDGDISLAHAKKKCDHLGLIFPWEPLTEATETTQGTTNTTAQDETHQEEIKRLQDRIAELEAELKTLHQQQSEQATAQETKNQGESLDFYQVTDMLRAVQLVQNTFYNPDSEHLKKENRQPTEIKLATIIEWIKENIPEAENTKKRAEALDIIARTFRRPI